MLHAQAYEEDWYTEAEFPSEDSESADSQPGDKVFVTFNWGAAASWLTRIINQEERSNFVFKDFMPGLYFGMEMHNIKYIIPMIRLTAYYPLTSTFNDMPQKPNTPVHFGIDGLAGIQFKPIPLMIDGLSLCIGPALHLLFLNSDRWNYFNLGAAAVVGIELALGQKWTMIIGGVASLDNGNLGGNREMEPFDIVYQYQVNLGFRYSRKKLNVVSLFDKINNKNKGAQNKSPDDFDDIFMEGEGFRR